jgi:hypothetical protein
MTNEYSINNITTNISIYPKQATIGLSKNVPSNCMLVQNSLSIWEKLFPQAIWLVFSIYKPYINRLTRIRT